MKLTSILYALICAVAVVGLAAANKRGYVPFVTNSVNAVRSGTPAHFHK